jgi:hypothetical protein
MNRGSGLCLHPDLAGPAAKRFHPGDENRAWKAAPTTRTTLKALKLTPMRGGGNPEESEDSTFYETIKFGI